MSAPGAYSLDLYQGDTFAMSVTLTEKDTGDPIDLTGSTAAAQIRATANAPDPPLATFTATVDGPTGTIFLDLAATEAAALPGGKYVWDVQTTDAAGRVRTWLAGNATVIAEVTRP